MRFTIRQSAAIFATIAYTAVMVAGYSLHIAAGCAHSHAESACSSHCCHQHAHGPQSGEKSDAPAPAHDSDDCVICAFHHLGQVTSPPVSLPDVEPLCEAASPDPLHPYVRAQRALCRSRAPPA